MDPFLHFFQTVKWQDLLDIALNSYILFRLYVLFRGTSAFRVLVGVAIFWIFNKLALSLGLVVTSWVIQGITLVAAVIIVVVFRNEIRSVLQAKNLKSILWGFPRSVEETPAEAVAEAVFDLAHTRTGALLILPGKEDLSEAIHSGIPWNGLLSKEMIKTAQAATGFVTEAISNTVCSVTGTPRSRSARPNPPDHDSSPSNTIATVTPLARGQS